MQCSISLLTAEDSMNVTRLKVDLDTARFVGTINIPGLLKHNAARTVAQNSVSFGLCKEVFKIWVVVLKL